MQIEYMNVSAEMKFLPRTPPEHLIERRLKRSRNVCDFTTLFSGTHTTSVRKFPTQPKNLCLFFSSVHSLIKILEKVASPIIVGQYFISLTELCTLAFDLFIVSQTKGYKPFRLFYLIVFRFS